MGRSSGMANGLKKLIWGGVLGVFSAACGGGTPARAAAAPPVCPFEIPLSAPPFMLERDVRVLPEGQALRVLAIGSSSTAGFGASGPKTAYPAQLAARLAAALAPRPVAVTNGGISGETAPATLKRLKTAMAAADPPQLVIWQVGTNDAIFGGKPDRLAAMVEEGLDAIAAAGATAILVDQQYFPGTLNRPRYEAFVAAVGEVAAARKVALVPRYAIMKQWAALDRSAYGALLAWDRFHMSDKGYACLADLLAAGILAPQPAPEGSAAAR